VSRRQLLVLLAILALAAFFRLWRLETIPPGLYADEAMNGNNALEALRTHDFKVFYPENNGREGLMIAIQAAFLKVLLPLNHDQPRPWMLRLPNAFFGTLTVLTVYLLASILLGEAVGCLSAFLLATSFWHILVSRTAFRANLAPLLLTASLWLLISALKQTEDRAFSWRAIVGGLLFGLGFYTYIAFRVAPILLLVILAFYPQRRYLWRNLTAFVLAAFVMALPLGIHFLRTPSDFFGRTSEISVFNSPNPVLSTGINIFKTAGMLHFFGDPNWRLNYSRRPELFWPVGILFLVGAWVADSENSARTENRFAAAFILSWIVIAAIPVVLSNEGMPHALRAVLMLPPIIILSAWGGVTLYRWLARRVRQVNALAAVFVILLSFEAYHTYFVRWARNSNVLAAFDAPSVSIADSLNRLPDMTDKVVMVDLGGVRVKGIPMPAQTVMFLTDTYDERLAVKKHFHYAQPESPGGLPEHGVLCSLKRGECVSY
jgi:4-amino-4-deoxy-L-arabinose transferase-like glycosyltransferase